MIDKPQAIFIPRCDVDEDIFRNITNDTFTCEETHWPKTFTHKKTIKLSEKDTQSIKRAIRLTNKDLLKGEIGNEIHLGFKTVS